MRFSRMLIPTLKEAPSDAEIVSHQLMVRAGMVRKVAAGIYTLLPLGLRAIRRVERIVREEMDRAGAQELFMPTVIPAELWQTSGRWDAYGKELLRVKDRHNREFCLGPTHEEVITDLVGREVRSYRDLPLNLYQIQTKFRDEIRPRFGLMRGREFIMKDAYSFHATEEDAELEYKNMYDTYCRIFERCGLDFRPVEAETGNIGGSFSHEFMVLAETGEDAVVGCTKCTYGANVERAEAGYSHECDAGSSEKLDSIERVSTPGMKSVEEVSAFLKVSPHCLIKTLIYNSDMGVVAALVRGDYDLNEAKLLRELGAVWIELADEETVVKTTGAPSGFAGPVGLKCTIIADHSVKGIVNGVTGANDADAHLINVNPNRDFTVKSFSDLRVVVDGDDCPRCDGNLSIRRGIEVGHVFKLGTKYSNSMGATFLDEEGKQQPMIMGCYGIGIGRTVAACIEQNHDENGIAWPLPMAPFQVTILPLTAREKEVTEEAERLYREITALGVDVLLDDRDERAGVKFNDAELLGTPIRIVIGKKGLKEGGVEIKGRTEQEAQLVPLEGVIDEVRGRLSPA
ncbi:MAG: proline--tRNA ligase [Deltaproteobacteria bacterium]|nr:proline--tRNA ligase [Deltaproteobacteria bacterium]